MVTPKSNRTLLAAVGLLLIPISHGIAAGNESAELAAGWEPGPDGLVPAAGFSLDTTDRLQVLAFYNAIYLASEGAENRVGWTGSYTQNADGTLNCTRGTTSAVFREDVRRRVNWYRAMAGLPGDVTFDAVPALNDSGAGKPVVSAGTTKQAACQAAAYMNALSFVFDETFTLTHNPSSASHFCYSSTAWNGSSHSNLAVGYFGPKAVDVYIADDDLGDDQSNNVNMGHRRWILYSRASDMATGDTPAATLMSGGFPYPVLPSNALYVTGTHKAASEVETKFVSWPPAGWLPRVALPLRWTLSRPGTTFPTTVSGVKLTGPAGNIPVTILSSNVPNVADNTLVFQPQSLPSAASGDTAYTVTVTGISGNGAPSTWTWTTKVLDVDETGIAQSISGPVAPPAQGANFRYTPVPLATKYQISTASVAPAGTYVEGAESATPEIIVNKTGVYALRQGPGFEFTPKTGTKAFHLAFPLDSDEPDYAAHDQSFEITPEFLVAANSQLSFVEHFRWLFKDNRLSAEISVDGGTKWTEVYGRGGAYTFVEGAQYSSAAWDKVWAARSVSLAAWAGKTARVRFILRHNGLSFDGEDMGHGCFLDDITLTNVQRITPVAAFETAGTTATLTSDAASGGLVPGKPVMLRVRPKLGGRLMGYSAPMTITPTAATGYAAWVAGRYPGLGAASADDDGDGVANLMEFAFASNPQDAGSGSLPAPSLDKGALVMSFACPPAVSGVTYGAEFTTDLRTWTPVPDTGTGGTCVFAVPVTGGPPQGWMRLKATVAD